MSPPTGRRPGRPSKGDRVDTLVLMARPIREASQKRAQELGLPLCDYLARVIAEAHGITAPDYCYPERTPQQSLPGIAESVARPSVRPGGPRPTVHPAGG